MDGLKEDCKELYSQQDGYIISLALSLDVISPFCFTWIEFESFLLFV